jgi:hypothetical protein
MLINELTSGRKQQVVILIVNVDPDFSIEL